MKTAIKRITRECVLVLAILSIVNLAAYIYYPKAIIPVYKQLRTFVHGAEIQDYDEVYEIFGKIKRLVPREAARHLHLEVRASDQINAWVHHHGRVVMTTGFIKAVNNDRAAIALVLGHEVAHFVLGHTDMTEESESIKHSSAFHELMADNLGLTLALGAGYDACAGAKVWDQFSRDYGMSLYPTSHPTHDTRAKNLERLCRGII